MKYVFDASAGSKLTLPEIDSDRAAALLADYSRGVHELLAPDFYPVEVAHAITRAERQKRISPNDGVAALIDF